MPTREWRSGRTKAERWRTPSGGAGLRSTAEGSGPSATRARASCGRPSVAIETRASVTPPSGGEISDTEAPRAVSDTRRLVFFAPRARLGRKVATQKGTVLLKISTRHRFKKHCFCPPSSFSSSLPIFVCYLQNPLPPTEQFRRLVASSLICSLSCKINGQMLFRRAHIPLRVPSFSSSEHHLVPTWERDAPSTATHQLGTFHSLEPDEDRAEHSFAMDLAESFTDLVFHIELQHAGRLLPS